MERPDFGAEAKLRYLDSDYQVLTPGSYVTCAVTGTRINLEELKYWSVDRQEAYRDAETAIARYRQFGKM